MLCMTNFNASDRTMQQILIKQFDFSLSHGLFLASSFLCYILALCSYGKNIILESRPTGMSGRGRAKDVI